MPARLPINGNGRVLLASDVPSPDAEMTAALQGAGCEVVSPVDYRQALGVAQERRVRVLILDFEKNLEALAGLASDWGGAAWRFRTLLLARSLEQLALAGEIPGLSVLLKPLTPGQLHVVVGDLLAGLGMGPAAMPWRPEARPRERSPARLAWCPEGQTKDLRQ